MPRRPRARPQWEPIPEREHGTGSVSRDRKTGAIRVRLPARIDPKRTSRKFKPHELADALRWLDSMLRGGTHTPMTPLVNWAGSWWETAIQPNHPQTTADGYLKALADLNLIGHLALIAVLPSSLRLVVADCQKRLAPSTLRMRASVWRSCLEAAVDDGLIPTNPMRKVKLPKVVKSKARRGWTAKEVSALWAAIEGHRFELIFALVLACGLRIGEVLGISWKNVDLQGRCIWIGPQYTDGVWQESPKGNNPHWVTVPRAVVAMLIRHHDSQPPGTSLVFASPHKPGLPWSYSTVRRDLIAVCESVGIDEKNLHAGRHAFGSYLTDIGIKLPVVAEMMGHADPSITASTYIHASDDALTQAYEMMDRLFQRGDGEGKTE